ncbi:MAG: superoxide dismutase [Opitutae bacterium]|jgi:superoxide dismutase, Fe-Mn family|nr:superoxide dismutase [Opitutae bacterium]MBT7406226.1 superoxide dismutase [Opitutae bacterium]
MTFTLPNLNFATDALEPHIDARTMEIHHGKHHQTYINNLNAVLEGHDDLSKMEINNLISDISSLPESIRGAVRNNGGGHANHSFFWESISPQGGGLPDGALNEAISATFGNFDALKDTFLKASLTRFGSGWAWLIQQSDGTLTITSTPNQDSPLMEGIADDIGTPLIGLDVWEHAYYLNYQNRRPDYVAAFWNVLDWNQVSSRFQS